jgi:hypothetical protein
MIENGFVSAGKPYLSGAQEIYAGGDVSVVEQICSLGK